MVYSDVYALSCLLVLLPPLYDYHVYFLIYHHTKSSFIQSAVVNIDIMKIICNDNLLYM